MSVTDPAPVIPVRAKIRQRRDLLVLGGLFVLFLIGLIGLAAATGWAETMAQLDKLTMLQIMGLLSLSIVNYVFRGIRWHLLCQRLGTSLTLRQNLLHFVAGFAMTITPGRIGELIRLRWIARLTDWRIERITPLPLVDRAFDLAAMGLVLAAGVVLSQTGIIGAIPVAILAFGVAILVTRPKLLAVIITWLWKIVGRWPRPFVRLRQAAKSMGLFSPAIIAIPALTLSVISWLAEGIALFLLLNWLGADVSIAAAVVIFVFSTLAGGLTGAPGGIGGAEVAMVSLLTMQGVPIEMSIPATAVIRITSLWFAIVIGIITFPLAEKFSNKD